MQLQQASDDQLFARARRGDRKAFAGLVERHQHALVGYLIRLVGDRDRAEDVAQETFLRLLERGKGYRAQGKLKAYLYRIATNLVRSEERQLLRRQFLASTFLRLDRGSNPPTQDQEVMLAELRQELSSALASLPLHYRVPVILCDVEDWSYEEIARLMRCRRGTVKSRIHRGRALLRQQLENRSNGGSRWQPRIVKTG